MRTRLISSLAIAALALSACGGGGGKQGEAADMLLEAAEEEEMFDLDEDCVRDVADKLSDEDAQKIVDAGPDGGDVSLSAEGEALANEMFGCVDTDALVDSVIADLVNELGEDNVDVDCIKDAVRGIDVSNPEDVLGGAMMECVSFG